MRKRFCATCGRAARSNLLASVAIVILVTMFAVAAIVIFRLNRRIASLESELLAARAGVHASHSLSSVSLAGSKMQWELVSKMAAEGSAYPRSVVEQLGSPDRIVGRHWYYKPFSSEGYVHFNLESSGWKIDILEPPADVK